MHSVPVRHFLFYQIDIRSVARSSHLEVFKWNLFAVEEDSQAWRGAGDIVSASREKRHSVGV